MSFITNFDFSILDFIKDTFSCSFLDNVFPLITRLGNGGFIWIAVAVILLFFKKTRKTGIMVGVALIIGLVTVNLGLKPLIHRIRPYDLKTSVEILIAKPTDFSFPSGHTLASFEAATVLMVRDKRFGIPATVIAVLIAFSRLYLYVHYPSDVLAAMILGVLWGLLAVFIVNHTEKYIKKRKQLKN